jgi:O-antigen/teichoic acid export membrane protein
MNIRVKASPFAKDMIWTTITSAFTVLSFILVTRILANVFGPVEFGAYSIARRILAILEPLSTCNMGIALSRYVAINTDNKEGLFFSGLLLGLIPSALLLIISFIFRNQLAVLVFQGQKYALLMLATFLLVLGYSSFVILYGYFRGIGNIFAANLWQVMLIAVAPLLIAIKYAAPSGADKITFLNSLTFLFILIPIGVIFYKAFLAKKIALVNKADLAELFRYGVFRIPASFAYGGIFSIGILLSPYFCSLKCAGYLVVGISVLRIIEGCLDSFSRVALPRIAKLTASGEKLVLKEKITDLLNFIIHLGLFASLHIFLWTDQLVLVWLGQDYLDAVSVVNIFSTAVIPFMLYSMLKTVIDALEVKAINTNNLYFSFAITTAACFIFAKLGWGMSGLAAATVLGIFTLGILTVRYLFNSFQIGLTDLVIGNCFILNISLFLLAVLAKAAIIHYSGGLLLCVYAGIAESLFFAVYCFGLYACNIRWIREAAKRIRLE